MTDFEEYKEHIRYTHHAYCKIVIRHAAIDAVRRLISRWKREISFEYMAEEKFYPFSTMDIYFAEPEPCEEYPFTVCGQTVMLNSAALAEALSKLPGQAQEEVFLYYFQRQTQEEVSKRYGQTRSTAGRHIRLAVKQLHEEMEGSYAERNSLL